MASAHELGSEPTPRSMEFPILVYHTDEGWVGTSLLTCTTAVSANPADALEEVISLLCTEVQYALDLAKGDLDAALEAVRCPADEELWFKYFQGPLKQFEPRVIVLQEHRRVTILPKEELVAA